MVVYFLQEIFFLYNLQRQQQDYQHILVIILADANKFYMILVLRWM